MREILKRQINAVEAKAGMDTAKREPIRLGIVNTKGELLKVVTLGLGGPYNESRGWD